MRSTRLPFVKCRKCGTIYYRIKVETVRDVHQKADCRVCGAEFKRRIDGIVYKYFRARHRKNPGKVI
jgi:hypothetical protein